MHDAVMSQAVVFSSPLAIGNNQDVTWLRLVNELKEKKVFIVTST